MNTVCAIILAAMFAYSFTYWVVSIDRGESK